MKGWLFTGALFFLCFVSLVTYAKSEGKKETTDIKCYEHVNHIRDLSEGKLYTTAQRFYKSKLPDVNKYTSDGFLSVSECFRVDKIITDAADAETYFKHLQIKKDALQ